MLGALILQQTQNLSDEEVQREVALDLGWHYALDITDDTDASTYISERTFRNYRRMILADTCFFQVKPSESSRTLEELSRDLVFLIETFSTHDAIPRMPEYRILERVLREKYRWRAGIEGTNSHLKLDLGMDRLRVRGMKSVRLAVSFKALGLNIMRCARALAACLGNVLAQIPIFFRPISLMHPLPDGSYQCFHALFQLFTRLPRKIFLAA